jgi:hypothetical protein
VTTDDPPAAPAPWWARAGDPALRLAGALVSLAGGVTVGLVAVLAVPWRLQTGFGVVRMPLAILFAAAGAAALVWFAPRAAGTRWAVLLPATGWFFIAAVAVRRTPEGSHLLMPNDLVAALTLFAGTIVMVIGVVLALTGGAGRGTGAGRRPADVGRPAGAGSGGSVAPNRRL